MPKEDPVIFPNEMIGLHRIEFVNRVERIVDIKRWVVNHNGTPVWIETVEGKKYNWQNVISIQLKD